MVNLKQKYDSEMHKYHTVRMFEVKHRSSINNNSKPEASLTNKMNHFVTSRKRKSMFERAIQPSSNKQINNIMPTSGGFAAIRLRS